MIVELEDGRRGLALIWHGWNVDIETKTLYIFDGEKKEKQAW